MTPLHQVQTNASVIIVILTCFVCATRCADEVASRYAPVLSLCTFPAFLVHWEAILRDKGGSTWYFDELQKIFLVIQRILRLLKVKAICYMSIKLVSSTGWTTSIYLSYKVQSPHVLLMRERERDYYYHLLWKFDYAPY